MGFSYRLRTQTIQGKIDNLDTDTVQADEGSLPAEWGEAYIDYPAIKKAILDAQQKRDKRNGAGAGKQVEEKAQKILALLDDELEKADETPFCHLVREQRTYTLTCRSRPSMKTSCKKPGSA